MVINDMKDMINKLDFYLDNKVMIHVDLKDGTFLNGIIVKKSKEGVYWMEERKLGKVFLFVRDINKINEYRGVKV
tara:strand:+ start:991 stop:1215 length:225 start_codon:yes stop_codon:yes gene_type:complete